MKDPLLPGGLAGDADSAADEQTTLSPQARVMLELLDQLSLDEEDRGCDPYDMNGSKRALEVWRRTPKRR